jgi:pantoate kinase
MDEPARAFVPGHVTAFFSVHRREDPARTGSRGAGITLSEGVTVAVDPAPETRIALDAEPTRIEPVECVLSALGATARVTVDPDLPIGAGFGVSGAAALGTALAGNRALDRAYSENELVRIAHVAEVNSGTGLGDVVAQARGGVPIRVEPGAPDHGALDGVPETGRIEYVSFGDLPTAEVISGDTDRLSAAGESALADLREHPALHRLFSLGREFAAEADLLVPEVREAVEAVTDRGGEATMAMLGRTVVAAGTGLSEAGYDAVSCRVHPAGATLRTGDATEG